MPVMMLDFLNVLNIDLLDFNLQQWNVGRGVGVIQNSDKSLQDPCLGCLNWQESKSRANGIVCTLSIPVTQDINVTKISPCSRSTSMLEIISHGWVEWKERHTETHVPRLNMQNQQILSPVFNDFLIIISDLNNPRPSWFLFKFPL